MAIIASENGKRAGRRMQMRPKHAAVVASGLAVLLLSSAAFSRVVDGVSHPETLAQSDQNTARGPEAPVQISGVELLSDTHGLDFGPYIKVLMTSLKASWNEVLAQHTVSPSDLKGSLTVRFTIKPDGSVSTMHLYPSGNVAFDRTAWQSLTQSAPFQPLPKAFTGSELELQVHFNTARKAADKS